MKSSVLLTSVDQRAVIVHLHCAVIMRIVDRITSQYACNIEMMLLPLTYRAFGRVQLEGRAAVKELQYT